MEASGGSGAKRAHETASYNEHFNRLLVCLLINVSHFTSTACKYNSVDGQSVVLTEANSPLKQPHSRTLICILNSFMSLFAWGHHGVQLSSSTPGKVTIGDGKIIAAACGSYHIIVATNDGLLRSLNLGSRSQGEASLRFSPQCDCLWDSH